MDVGHTLLLVCLLSNYSLCWFSSLWNLWLSSACFKCRREASWTIIISKEKVKVVQCLIRLQSLGSQPQMTSQKPSCRLPLLSARPVLPPSHKALMLFCHHHFILLGDPGIYVCEQLAWSHYTRPAPSPLHHHATLVLSSKQIMWSAFCMFTWHVWAYTLCTKKLDFVIFHCIFVATQGRIAWKSPEVHMRCWLLWIWNKLLWLVN